MNTYDTHDRSDATADQSAYGRCYMQNPVPFIASGNARSGCLAEILWLVNCPLLEGRVVLRTRRVAIWIHCNIAVVTRSIALKMIASIKFCAELRWLGWHSHILKTLRSRTSPKRSSHTHPRWKTRSQQKKTFRWTRESPLHQVCRYAQRCLIVSVKLHFQVSHRLSPLFDIFSSRQLCFFNSFIPLLTFLLSLLFSFFFPISPPSFFFLVFFSLFHSPFVFMSTHLLLFIPCLSFFVSFFSHCFLPWGPVYFSQPITDTTWLTKFTLNVIPDKSPCLHPPSGLQYDIKAQIIPSTERNETTSPDHLFSTLFRQPNKTCHTGAHCFRLVLTVVWLAYVVTKALR